MMVFRTIDEVRRSVAAARARGKAIGLVPTMGALHEGHYSLLRAARGECAFVVVSIFVNPLQFGPAEDLAAYPRTEAEDLAGCQAHGADAVFIPSVPEMYPGRCLTEVSVPGLAGGLCGRSRPGHFAGVCTVVAKLFNIVLPDRAYFGAKDYQQAAIIRRMATDLNFPTQIVVCPTVREADGLAMSSRNKYLSPAERASAGALYEALRLAEKLILEHHPPAGEVIAAVRQHISRKLPEGVIDYVEIVDPDGLEGVQGTSGRALVALAVRLGKARLIDNIVVDAGAPGR